MHWYKRDPDAALVGMTCLTLEEVGAYTLILDTLYSRDGDLPDNEQMLVCILHCNPRTWRKLRTALIAKGKIWINHNKIAAKRVEKELNAARNRCEKHSNSMRMRHQRKKKLNENNNRVLIARALQPQPQPEDSQKKNEASLPSSSSSLFAFSCENARSTGVERAHASVAKQEFEQFWKLYPRKVGKKAAFKSFLKARSEASIEALLGALEAQVPCWNDPQFVPHPTTWLNHGRWEDQPVNLQTARKTAAASTMSEEDRAFHQGMIEITKQRERERERANGQNHR